MPAAETALTARCLQGDATVPESYRRLLAGDRADFLHTDPPYCLLTRRRKKGDLRDPKDRKIERGPLRRFEDVREYREFTRAWLKLAVAHLREGAPLAIWTNFLGRQPIAEAAGELGYQRWGEYVWAKRTKEGSGAAEQLLRAYEVALVFGKEPLPERAPGEFALPWAVVAGYDDEGQAKAFGSHPNHKPFSVLEPLLRTWSRPKSRILDCFAGSGSIPAAAQQLGRHAYAMELEEAWAERVGQRLRDGAPPLAK